MVTIQAHITRKRSTGDVTVDTPFECQENSGKGRENEDRIFEVVFSTLLLGFLGKQTNHDTLISVHLTEVKTRKSQKIRQLLVSNLVGWVVGFITGNNIKYSGVFHTFIYVCYSFYSSRLYNCTWIII